MEDRIASTLSFGVNGVDGFPVRVEVFSVAGIPAMEIIGLPDASVRESRDRVNAAILNSGREMLPRRVTINLSPADLRKEGPSFDLPIALGVLLSMDNLHPAEGMDPGQFAVFGELSLDGRVQPVAGALPMAICAKESGVRKIILPEQNAREIACIEGLEVYPVHSLRHLRPDAGIGAVRPGSRYVQPGLHHERDGRRFGICAPVYAGVRRSVLRLRIQKNRRFLRKPARALSRRLIESDQNQASPRH